MLSYFLLNQLLPLCYITKTPHKFLVACNYGYLSFIHVTEVSLAKVWLLWVGLSLGFKFCVGLLHTSLTFFVSDMLFSWWWQKYMMQILLAKTSDVTKLNSSGCPGYIAMEKISPKLSGLKQQQSFYCFWWFLWVRNSGRAPLDGSGLESFVPFQSDDDWSRHSRRLTNVLRILHVFSHVG